MGEPTNVNWWSPDFWNSMSSFCLDSRSSVYPIAGFASDFTKILLQRLCHMAWSFCWCPDFAAFKFYSCFATVDDLWLNQPMPPHPQRTNSTEIRGFSKALRETNGWPAIEAALVRLVVRLGSQIISDLWGEHATRFRSEHHKLPDQVATFTSMPIHVKDSLLTASGVMHLGAKETWGKETPK